MCIPLAITQINLLMEKTQRVTMHGVSLAVPISALSNPRYKAVMTMITSTEVEMKIAKSRPTQGLQVPSA